MEYLLNEMDFFLQVEKEKQEKQEKEESDWQEFIDSIQRWDSKPHQILRSNHKNEPKTLKYYEKLQDLFEDGYFEELCRSLQNFVNVQASWLYRKIQGYKFNYADCLSEVWEVVARMIDDWDTTSAIPFVYRLKYKVQKNLFPNIVRDVHKAKRALNHSNKVDSIDLMKDLGKDMLDKKSLSIYDKVIEKVDRETKENQECDSLLLHGFTDLEIMIIRIQRHNPRVTTREIAGLLSISQSKACRTMKKIQDRLGA